jgi:hypothetical protein
MEVMMSKKTKTLFSASLIALLLVTILAGAALAQGQMPWRSGGTWGPGMMGNGDWSQSAPNNCGSGMMGGGFWNGARGMMGRFGMGMMGDQGWGPGAMAPSQCPLWGQANPTGQSLTLDDAQAIAAQYLIDYGNPDLEVAEIMQFSNNFYVEVHETSAGIGAMELLIDPSGALYPEPGPNMMWNVKYGHMAQGGMMGRGMMGGGMMGSLRQPSGDMTVSADEAIAAAKDWLDANLPGVMAGDEAEAFYGYYTIHTLTDGEISGMLSVNGSTGQVWYHNWHGDFVEMTGEHE